MFYYQEIALIEQEEIPHYFIWSKLYAQLHLAFVEVKNQNDKINIGVSFPQYFYEKNEGGKSKVGLGNELRIFSAAEDILEQLNIPKWLNRFTDYLHVNHIRDVPQNRVTAYASFSRKQVKTNAERLARRLVKKRDDTNFNEAVKLYQNKISSTDLPYIQMKSLTNNQPFKLFIERNIGKKTDINEFSVYGLSKVSTVPEF